jgi:hypothetical protein
VPLRPHNPAAITSLTVDGTTIASTYYALRGDELWVHADVADPTDANELGGDIVITFTGSEAQAQDLAVFKQAICMLVAYWYENREAVRTDGGYPAVVAQGYDYLIAPYKLLEI